MRKLTALVAAMEVSGASTMPLSQKGGRTIRHLGVVVLVAIALLMGGIPALAAVPVGERISLFQGDTTFAAGEPFHISHGFAGFVAPDPFRWDFILEVDGVAVAHDGVVVVPREDEFKLAGARVYNFPDGMTGTHILDGYWYQSCNGPDAQCEPGAPPGSLTQVLHLTIEVTFEGS